MSKVRKICNYFAGVGGVDKMSFHRVANQLEASKNISLANGRRMYRRNWSSFFFHTLP